MKVNEVDNINWQFITHEEREEIIDNNEQITRIEEKDTIDQGGCYETWYDGYIESVKAWISFSIYSH